jgi:sulfatase modifying factor 1
MNRHLSLPVALALALVASPALADENDVRKAVTFYASFDEAVKGDVGGELAPGTRFPHPTDKGQFVFEKGIDEKVLRITQGNGIAGGAFEATDVLPKNGRMFFPVKGNLAYKPGGWSGSVSLWCNTDPDKLIKSRFCDPVQITQKSANNGALWFDFNDAKPMRDLRHGAFPAVPEGQKGITEDDPKAPLVRVPKVGWKDGDWHHVVLTFKNLDTGKADAVTALYIDGKLIGEVKDRAIAMGWDIDKANVYFSLGYVGLLDEFALFDRALTAEEVGMLHKKPDLLSLLKKKPLPEKPPVPLTASPNVPKFPFDSATAARYQREYADWLGLPTEFTNDLGMTFVLIPPGTFQMGTPEDEPGHKGAEYPEGPQHQVTLTRPFYLGKHEVTVGQFRAFVEATKYTTDGEKTGGGNAHDDRAVWKHRPGTNWKKPGYAAPFEMKDAHPVVHVSHTDALAFSAWLKEKAGSSAFKEFGLPTEAQWEWACRAGTATAYWWGAEPDTTGKVANVGDRTLKKIHPEWPRVVMPMDDGHAFPAPVGSYRANAFGLHDTLGNVWEFCSTHFGAYSKEPVTDPGDLDPKRGFAVRGGGWSNAPTDARCGLRNADPPHFCHSNLGFRVALAIPAK